ncbi:pyruvate kinase [Anoxybacter fermentans]|uniref:Pyruvate kinase n=2 Tax=Bacteria TaxID=2 RepID=A0A3S9T256_9FIRM|nr:pyruvate kinase [Anoxybacter fermentans]AZR74623.1 pyruvate kinase [Anoxybacter fermentans]
MRRTKIVCTIGPASESKEVLKELIKAGMNVARLNFSHGSHEEHGRRIKRIREAAKELGVNVAIMLDTKGPEIRSGILKEDKVELVKGQKLILTTEEIEGDANRVSVSYKNLPNDLYEGARILVDDGLIELKVEKIYENEIHTVVINGGILGSRKSINLPGVKINLPALTQKDIDDLKFGIEQGVDFIAASFVRKAADVLEIRRILEEAGADIHIISKIENAEGVENIDEIIKVSDGIMVARGDLGVEIPAEQVPIVQKMIIRKCNKAGKPVITATQMLDSMIRNPRPTRAEASDVANAIFDGTDATMLSGETAAGSYPVEAVKMMARIAERTESSLSFEEILANFDTPEATTTDAISYATCNIALDLGAAAIITSTRSGYTARAVSKYRPKSPIIAATPNESVLRKLLLAFGVYPILVPETSTTDEMIEVSVNGALEQGLINEGDLVVITAGTPVGVPGTTNLLKVHVAGKVLVRGTGIGKTAKTGRVVIANNAKEAIEKVKEGDILVAYETDREWMPAIEKVVAIITERGGLTSHAAIVGLNLGIPVIVGAEDAMSILEDEMVVTVDCIRGQVYRGKATVL